MMEWRPDGYLFDTNNLIRALFDENTAEGQLLDAANAGYIDIIESKIFEEQQLEKKGNI